MAKCDRLLTSGISREKEIVRLTTPKKDVNNMEWKTSWSPTEIFSQLKLKTCVYLDYESYQPAWRKTELVLEKKT